MRLVQRADRTWQTLRHVPPRQLFRRAELMARFRLGRFLPAGGGGAMPRLADELLSSEQHEFGRDYRTGRPVISTRESLERILACYPTGIIVGPSAHWGRPELINNDLAMMITAHAQPLPLPKRSQLSAYVWEHASPPAGDSRCQGLPVFRHGTDGAG